MYMVCTSTKILNPEREMQHKNIIMHFQNTKQMLCILEQGVGKYVYVIMALL